MSSGRSRMPRVAALAIAVAFAACGGGRDEEASSASSTTRATIALATPALTPTPTTATTAPATTRLPTTSTAPAATTTTPSTAPTPTITTIVLPSPESTTTVSPSEPTATPTPGLSPVLDPSMPRANAAFEALARNNAAASVTAMRDGEIIVNRASGNTLDGMPATPDSPMLVASVSKMVTAFAVARLDQQGLLDVAGTMPWALMGFAPDERWNDVTIRELLDHTSGMPVARPSWFVGGGDCRSFLPSLLSSGPESNRGTWRYSNGNYCALGLLVEFVTEQPLDAAIQRLVFDPLGAEGLHLSTGGLDPADVPHGNDIGRLSRLGGAGTFVVSTEDLARMLSATSFDDLDTLLPPGVFTDQYGWGHTGTVQGAISCIWVLELGRTVVAATIAGNSPAKGGGICDRVVPAIAEDLGIGQGRPDRTP